MVPSHLAIGRAREAVVLASLVLVLLFAFVSSLVAGSTHIPFASVLAVLTRSAPVDQAGATVIETIRLPRSLTAMLAGASLAIAGLQMQTLFRNPLADPFALGISSGASLGVSLVVLGSGFKVGT